jgi:hypothetical protein
MKKLLLLCVMLSLWMFGCGNETSGTLSVSAPSANNGVVTARATFIPSNGTVIPGQPINFRWYTVGATSKTQSAELATSGHTDSTGTVTSQLTLPATRTESFIVYVTASTGDLTNIEGWQSVLVVP